MSQLHKRFTSEQVKEFLDRYLKNEIERKYVQEILGIKKRWFFVLLKHYQENPQHFTVQVNSSMCNVLKIPTSKVCTFNFS